MIKNILLFLSFGFLVSTSVLFAQQKYPDAFSVGKISIFKESFENNLNKWITDNLWVNGEFSNGVYIITCKNYQGQTGLSYKPITIDKTQDYELETSFKVVRGIGGMVFGQTAKFDHYRIEFGNKDNILILKDTPSKKKTVEILFTGSAKLISKTGDFNKLTIRKINDIFYFFINDSLVSRKNNIKPEGEQVGFNVGVNSEIAIDYINVSYLVKQVTPVLANRDLTKKDSVSNPPLKNLTSALSDSSAKNVVNNGAPILKWTSPSTERTQFKEYSAPVRALIKSGSRLEKVMFYVNGISVGEGEFQPVTGEPGSYRVVKLIYFKPGENSVFFTATDEGQRTQKSDVIYFTNPETTPPEFIWGSPVDAKSITNVEILNIDAVVKSASGLTAARILVNGIPIEENPSNLQPTPNGEIRLQRQVILKDGENSLYISATNAAGTNYSEGRIVILNKTIAEKRIALIIGNSNYQNSVSLKNPVNDANLMEATLRSLDFKIIKGLNMGIKPMLDSIREFSRKLSSYNVALFYFAGHGLQVDGVNYLIPVDAKLNDKNDCNWEAIAVNKVTDEFKKHTTNTNIVILDACRNNPYKSWARGEEAGFKAMGPINGTIISFATSEGSTAADGSGYNGPFTEELVKQMGIPQQIENVFKNTRKKVKERTKDLQIPMEWNYLTEDFYFVKPVNK